MRVLSFAVLLSALLAAPVAAQDRPHGKPGQFDFYVLALTWSPSFCAEARERDPDRLPQPQCGGRPFAFVVHGLWPQYERGFPEYCRTPAPRLDRTLIDAMLDVMPSPALVEHEWRRHGTCNGGSAYDYFATVRAARAAVTVPAQFSELERPRTITATALEAAFLAANPQLTAKGIAVMCNKSRLSEVRICLDRDLRFRDCEEIDRQACRAAGPLTMPAVRGGTSAPTKR